MKNYTEPLVGLRANLGRYITRLMHIAIQEADYDSACMSAKVCAKLKAQLETVIREVRAEYFRHANFTADSVDITEQSRQLEVIYSKATRAMEKQTYAKALSLYQLYQSNAEYLLRQVWSLSAAWVTYHTLLMQCQKILEQLSFALVDKPLTPAKNRLLEPHDKLWQRYREVQALGQSLKVTTEIRLVAVKTLFRQLKSLEERFLLAHHTASLDRATMRIQELLRLA